jgi:NUMOD4 motif/HNH endonuclease
MTNWCAVPGYDRYEISDEGRVRRVSSGKLLKGIPDSCGYLRVDLYSSVGVHRTELIHRLVLRAFVGEPSKGLECRHLDGKPNNNALINLAWGSRTEQADDRRRHGTEHYPGAINPLHGEANPAAKLTAGKVRYIRKMLECKFKRQDIADEFGITKRMVYYIKDRDNWTAI